ncbi:MAG TPA: hypothetical protein VIF57_00465 [Polyangia bacterium]|jgi:hypothetical protein
MTRSLLAIAVLAVAVTGFACKRHKSTGGACVDVGGAACQACRDKTTAQFCAPSYVAPQASGNIKVNGQKGCCGFEDPALRASCENILRCIRSHGCGAGNSPVACLCGEAGMGACAAATDWSGVCAPVYKAALAGGPPGTLIRLFGDPRGPIGVANNTFTCDVDSACPCGDKPAPKK